MLAALTQRTLSHQIDLYSDSKKERHQKRLLLLLLLVLFRLLFFDSHFLQQQVTIKTLWPLPNTNLILGVSFFVEFCRLYVYMCKSQFIRTESQRSKSVAYRTTYSYLFLFVLSQNRRWQKTSLNCSPSVSVSLSLSLSLPQFPFSSCVNVLSCFLTTVSVIS